MRLGGHEKPEGLKFRRRLNLKLAPDRQHHQVFSLSLGSHCPQNVGSVEAAERLRITEALHLKSDIRAALFEFHIGLAHHSRGDSRTRHIDSRLLVFWYFTT